MVQLDLLDELAEMAAERNTAWAEKKARTEALRRQLAEARVAGKAKRHEQRLRRQQREGTP